MKRCFKCGEVKFLFEFYDHPMMADGHLGKCKECVKQYAKEHRKSNRAYYVQYDKARFQSPERKAKCIEYQKVRRFRNPEKDKAHVMVNNWIRAGKLIRQPCEICGGKSQAHHDDYSRPLEVRWLCFMHHRELMHNQIVTT